MPFHTVTLPDIEQSVARPVIFDILNQVFEITKLSKDTMIYYHGKTTNILTPGTSIDDKHRDAKFASNRYTFVEVNESYQVGAIQETHVNGKEHAPVFQDKSLGLELRPIYTTSDVVISIRYRAPSETEVKRWLAEMLIKTAHGRDINLHSVKYTYPLPYPYLTLIEDVWRLREASAGYGDQFEKYIVDKGTDRLTILADRAGEKRHLAIRETQSRILGQFDFSGIPEAPSKDNGSGIWEIVFNYKFSYQRPDGMYLEYPLMVHNQLMPDKYIPESEHKRDSTMRTSHYSSSYEALSIFESDRITNEHRPPFYYVRIPDYDYFHMQNMEIATGTLIIALTQLDEDRKDILGFNDFGDYVIDQDVMEFLYGEAPYMLNLYHSFFYVSIYGNDVVMDKRFFEITDQLMVRAKEPLDPRRTYRFRLSLILDPSLLTWEALLRLSKYPKAFVKVLAAINDLLRTNPAFIKLYNNKRIEPWEISYAWWVLNGGRNSGRDSYDWNSMGGICGKKGEEFLHSIPRDVIDRHFRDKRVGHLTVQNTAIIVRPGGSICK